MGFLCNLGFGMCLQIVADTLQAILTFAPLLPVLLLPQGLADTFLLLGLPFDSDEAKQLNKEIFETIYFASLQVGGGHDHCRPVLGVEGKCCRAAHRGPSPRSL